MLHSILMVFFVEVSLGHANGHLKSLACIWGGGIPVTSPMHNGSLHLRQQESLVEISILKILLLKILTAQFFHLYSPLRLPHLGCKNPNDQSDGNKESSAFLCLDFFLIYSPDMVDLFIPPIDNKGWTIIHEPA